MRKGSLRCFRFDSLMVAVAVSLASLSCRQGTPAPGFAAPYDSVPPDTLLAYIGTLQFDTREWAGDAQRLMVGTCPASCDHGPLVRIEPESRAHRNQTSSLQDMQGRIIARMVNSSPTDSYPKYNLAPSDTVYWAVREVSSFSDDTAHGVSLYISTRGLHGTHPTPFVYDSTLVERHGSNYYPNRASAHWVWSDADEEKWGHCGSSACCR
jgi:hypothetical protein